MFGNAYGKKNVRAASAFNHNAQRGKVGSPQKRIDNTGLQGTPSHFPTTVVERRGLAASNEFFESTARRGRLSKIKDLRELISDHQRS